MSTVSTIILIYVLLYSINTVLVVVLNESNAITVYMPDSISNLLMA